MTAMIRLYSLYSDLHEAQLTKLELGLLDVRSDKDKLGRMNCVKEPGWN